MKRGQMMRKLWVVLFAVLTGCAIAPAKYLDPNVAQPSPAKHVLTVERTKAVAANSVPLTIYVDGLAAAEISGGQALNLYLPAGRHIIGIGITGRSNNPVPEREIAVDVSSTSHPILRAGPVAFGYGGWGIERAE